MSSPKPIGYIALVRTNVNFRRLWLGNVVSLFGDWFNTIALYTLISQLTGSPFALGAVFITKMLPSALASPIAGLLVDRLNRRWVMIGSDLIRAVIVLGFLLIDDPSEVYLIYILTALQVIFGAVFTPAKSASLPNITSPQELLTANALMAATWSTLLALGAAVGGFAVEWLGMDAVFIIDSLTYLVSAYFIFRTTIPQNTEKPSHGPLIQTAMLAIWKGWTHMRQFPHIGRIALAKASWALAGGALVFMLALLGEEIAPEAQAIGIGILFAARGIGTGIGPVVARAVFKDQSHWPTVLGASVAASGAFYMAVGFLPWTYVVVVAVVIAHALSGANWVLSTVLLQQRTEDAYRGRVFATDWLLVMLADTIAILAASTLLESGVIDLRMGFIVFAIAQILCGLLWLVTVVPQERKALVKG